MYTHRFPPHYPPAPVPPQYTDGVDTLAWNLGRLIGLGGSLGVAALARVRALSERLVWGFDDGWGPAPGGCRCASCCRVAVRCVPLGSECGPWRRCP